MKKKKKTKLEQIEWNYVIQFIKKITIYYIKCVCFRIWVARYIISNFKVLENNCFPYVF